MCECEAADERGPCCGGPLGILRRVIRECLPRQLPSTPCHIGEPIGPARLDRDRFTQTRQHKAVAIRLFEAGEAVIGPLGV